MCELPTDATGRLDLRATTVYFKPSKTDILCCILISRGLDFFLLLLLLLLPLSEPGPESAQGGVSASASAGQAGQQQALLGGGGGGLCRLLAVAGRTLGAKGGEGWRGKEVEEAER